MYSQQEQSPNDEQSVSQSPKVIEETFRGELFAWAETGTEGFVWAMQEDGKQGYDGLVVLEQGDAVEIRNSAGDLVFSGIIMPDRQSNWTPHYDGASHGQPLAHGCWIHWTQKGWSPEAWMELFMNEDHRATIIRTKEAESS